MKILVIGGSYFFGRWFVQKAYKNHEVTVLNRGNIPVNLENVRSFIADRTDLAALKKYEGEKFDCIVDFCAYNPGDISKVCEVFADSKTRYLFISTVDVYKKTLTKIKEDSDFEDRFADNQVGEYIRGKVELEKELSECGLRYSMEYSAIRPAIIYGPANYAPREKMYFDWINQAGQIIVPCNSSGKFQFIYVADAADALLKLCEISKEKLYNSYNFANEKIENYESFHRALRKAVDKEYEEIPVDVSEILSKNIPLPFPLLEEESAIYDTERFMNLEISTTDLAEGLRKANI